MLPTVNGQFPGRLVLADPAQGQVMMRGHLEASEPDGQDEPDADEPEDDENAW